MKLISENPRLNIRSGRCAISVVINSELRLLNEE